MFVHPRNPYARVDALRSTRRVRVELDGVVLAETASPVMVFETGLPTRYYLNRTEVDFEHLVADRHRDRVPLQGHDQRLLVGAVGERLHPDLAWAYDFPTRQLLPIAGLIAFYNEKVDITSTASGWTVRRRQDGAAEVTSMPVSIMAAMRARRSGRSSVLIGRSDCGDQRTTWP